MPILDPLPLDFGDISAAEAVEFVCGVAQQVKAPPPTVLYLMNPGADGFALSFDGGWSPFIGRGSGFNQEKDRRYLQDGITLVRRMRELLEKEARPRPGPAGGRYFLSFDGIRRITADQDRVHVVKWQWPLNLEDTLSPRA